MAVWNDGGLVAWVCAALVASSCAGSSWARCTPGAGLAAIGAPSPARRDWARVSLAGRPEGAAGEAALAAR
jgi:hypothetical protein